MALSGACAACSGPLSRINVWQVSGDAETAHSEMCCTDEACSQYDVAVP